MWKAVFLLAISSLAPTLVLGQGNPALVDKLAARMFDLDYAAFRDSAAGNLSVEIFYKVFSSGLSYQKWGDKFKADYTVDITVKKKGKQITGSSNDGSLIADDYKMSKSKDDFVINRIVFSLPPDNYELVARLSDPNSGEAHEPVKIDMPLRSLGDEIPGLSTLEFAREASYSQSDSEFIRHGTRIIPSVSRVYGDEEPDLILFYEIYNSPEFMGDYLATYQILNNDKTVSVDSSLFVCSGAVTPRLEMIGVDDLLPGEYDIVANISSPGGKLHLKTRDHFKIGWSVLGLVKNDFKTALEQLRYIATPEQMKKLADAPVEDRIRLWDEYWRSKDPTPGTPENELKDEYYKRLRYSDINFGNFGRNGWKTDMGMVYVTYGPPDEIERHPFDLDAKPYQIWYYYGLKRIFRFVDINGYGEYELLYPYDGDPRKIR
jgi:GWxTD domain-containing protein